MLPLGRLALGARDSRFTPDEQQTLMTLWAITRSPLIMGGDLRHLDGATLKLLTNRAVIAVDQASTDSQPHWVMDGIRVWTARGAEGEMILAVFNVTDKAKTIELELARLGIAAMAGRDLWNDRPVNAPGGRLSLSLPAHGSMLYALR
jgi:alpha-galactosidase